MEGESPVHDRRVYRPAVIPFHRVALLESAALIGWYTSSKAKYWHETDSVQVPWGKDAKNFEKRVKQCVKPLKGKPMSAVSRTVGVSAWICELSYVFFGFVSVSDCIGFWSKDECTTPIGVSDCIGRAGKNRDWVHFFGFGDFSVQQFSWWRYLRIWISVHELCVVLWYAELYF